MNDHRCTECGELHLSPPTHKEVLSKLKLVMLRRAADHVIETMSNDFMVRDISKPEEYSMFHNFQKLRYHGLVAPARDGVGRKIKGRWLITRNGWAFLRGDIELSKYVLVSGNHIKERSDEKTTCNRVAQGSVEITTRFEYFSDDNKPVGFRPVAPISKPIQETLAI